MTILDRIIRYMIGGDAKGCVRVDGTGIHPGVRLAGDRSSAAIDSLKVIAFDLAVMCRSIEGAAAPPALWIHDSPREADLGLSIYHQLFRLVNQLEKFGEEPLFQYIITTTSRPADEFCKEPWLRLKLEGAPASERLLRRDL
jgi:hypothetical protein